MDKPSLITRVSMVIIHSIDDYDGSGLLDLVNDVFLQLTLCLLFVFNLFYLSIKSLLLELKCVY